MNAGTSQGNRYIVLKNFLPFTLSLFTKIANIKPRKIARVNAAKVQINVKPISSKKLYLLYLDL